MTTLISLWCAPMGDRYLDTVYSAVWREKNIGAVVTSAGGRTTWGVPPKPGSVQRAMTESVLFLNRSAVRACVRRARHICGHRGRIAGPRRKMCGHSGGRLFGMAERRAYCRSIAMLGGLRGSTGAVYGLKVIKAAVSNPQYGLERAGGFSFLFDTQTARAKVIAEAGYLSAVRTAGYSVLSIEQLGPASWDSASLIGCGTQAEVHVEMLIKYFPGFRYLSVFDLDRARAEQFKEKVAEKYLGLEGRSHRHRPGCRTVGSGGHHGDDE